MLRGCYSRFLRRSAATRVLAPLERAARLFASGLYNAYGASAARCHGAVQAAPLRTQLSYMLRLSIDAAHLIL